MFIGKKVAKTLVPLALGGCLVWYSISEISLEVLVNYFQNANYNWVFLGLFFGILSHLSRAYRWRFIIKPLGFKPKFMNSFFALLVGYLINLTIPRAGEVSRALVLYNYERVPFENGLGTIVAERMIDLVMMVLIVIITLVIQFDFIYELSTKNFDPVKMGVALLILIGGLLILSYAVRKSTSGILLKLKTFAIGLFEGVTSIFKMENKWSFIFHTLFIWIMYVLMFWATIPAIEGLEVPFGGVLIGFIAGGLSIATTSGGIGLYPIAVASAFTLFDVSTEPATAFGWIIWTAQTATVIVFGGLSFLLLPIYGKAK